MAMTQSHYPQRNLQIRKTFTNNLEMLFIGCFALYKNYIYGDAYSFGC